MNRAFVASALFLLASAAASLAQPLASPTPPLVDAPPRSIKPQPLPPLPPAASEPTATAPAAAPPSSETAAPSRVFCDQQVAFCLADPAAISEEYRRFLGIWSDAAWTAQLCAALVVEDVRPDGTASLVYAFGPMESNSRARGGVLRGTGVIRDGELRFQNSDGSQYAFRPYYADLDGRYTTPQGQSYQAVFKKTP